MKNALSKESHRIYCPADARKWIDQLDQANTYTSSLIKARISQRRKDALGCQRIAKYVYQGVEYSYPALDAYFAKGITPAYRADCKFVATLSIVEPNAEPDAEPDADAEPYNTYEDLYFCAEQQIYWVYGNFKSESKLQKLEDDCNEISRNGIGYLEDTFVDEYGDDVSFFHDSFEKCVNFYGNELDCSKYYSCENLVIAVGEMYPDPVALEHALKEYQYSRPPDEFFIFNFSKGIQAILIGSWASSATVVVIGLTPFIPTISYLIIIAVMVVLLRMLAMYLRARHDSYDRRERIRREERNRTSPGDLKESRLPDVHRVWHSWYTRYSANKKEGMWMPHAAARATFSASMESISRLILQMSKPYSEADIMVVLVFAGYYIGYLVSYFNDGIKITSDGGPIVILATIVSLACMSRSVVLTGKNAEACFALMAMTLTPLSPVAGGASTLLVSAWLETSLTGTRTAGLIVPWHRAPLLLLNVFIALEYPLATMLISLSMGQAMMSTAAPVWWALLYEEGLSATCREELEEQYSISWILFYLHGGSHTSIGHRLTSNKRVIYPGGACQAAWLREGMVLLTKAGGGSAGLPWRVVSNDRGERGDYATALDGAYEQEMGVYAKKTRNRAPDKEHPGGRRYGYLH